MRIHRRQGKRVFYIVLLPLIVWSCNNREHFNGIKGDLNYAPVTEKSEFLSISLDLSAKITGQKIFAGLKLTNTGSKPVIITEITLHTEGGLLSQPLGGKIQNVIIQPGRDTVMVYEFKPVNDVKVYQLTGKQGHFKPQYKVSVFYKPGGEERSFSVDLITPLPAGDYKTYIDKYATPFTGYSFNTASNFDQTERDYLERMKFKHPVFAFVAQHELALTGLNIWMTSYCERDSLYAEFLVVNHNEYALRIIPDSLDFVYKDAGTPGKSKVIVLEKTAGSQQNKNSMEKGDKLLIHFKKPFKSSEKPVIITIKDAFIVSGSRPLFNDNVELLKVRLP